jgi:hypothetical protein
MSCDKLTLTLNNAQGLEARGCILYGYSNGQKVGHDGARPVPKQDGIRFQVNAAGMTDWRFIAAIDYSDEPENSDVVLLDTGIRPLTKCDWTIDVHPSTPQALRDAAKAVPHNVT